VSLRYRQPLRPLVVAVLITVILAVMTLIALQVTRRLGRPWFAETGALTNPLYLVRAPPRRHAVCSARASHRRPGGDPLAAVTISPSP
jgi:hypothetical protein